MRSKCGKNKKVAAMKSCHVSVWLTFLSHFDTLCDLFLYLPTVTWNLFNLYDKKAKCCLWWYHQCICQNCLNNVLNTYIMKVNFGPQGGDILQILCQRRIKIGHEVNPLYIIQLTWNEKNKLIGKMVLFFPKKKIISACL